MSIATKTGDKGTTGLLFGKRVPKTDLRIVTNGHVDELNASLGFARATLKGTIGEPFITSKLFDIQKELVLLMGEVAVASEDRERYVLSGYGCVKAEMVDALTGLVDVLETNYKISFKKWATPGDSLGSASLDVARTVCRRAERSVVELGEHDNTLNPEIVRYLNRLSDLCWLWARWVETMDGDKDE